MQGDGLFFLAILAFFFVLWLAGGGPSKPISFAGPYITPITNVGQTQVGYGGNWVPTIRVNGTLPGIRREQIQSTVADVQYQVNDLQIKVNKEKLIGTKSPYYDQVRISGGNTASTIPNQEYITLQVSSVAKSDIKISGWRLESVATGYNATIGQGSELPQAGSVNTKGPIILRPGETAYIVSGESPNGDSFRENMCSGYYEDAQRFYPAISQRCPAASREFDQYFTGNPIRDEGCYRLMQSTGTCRVPKETNSLSSYCYALIDKTLNYNGCVATHRLDAYFNTGTWRIFLGRTEITRNRSDRYDYGELWKSSREGIKLLDENGLTVDLYTY